MNNKIRKIKYNIVLFLTSFFVPSFIFAKSSSLRANNLSGLVKGIGLFINSWLIPMFVLAALVYFLIGVIQYIGISDDSKKSEKKQKMFWGLIGLFVMLSVWSLVFVIKNTFGISTGTNSEFMQMVKPDTNN